jgi:Fe-S cluster assembly protein SufD
MAPLAETRSAEAIGSFTREVFEAHLARVAHLPQWWLKRKREAYERFVSLPMPKRTDESWRFSNVAGLTLDGFSGVDPVGYESVGHSDIGVPGAGTLAIANHRKVLHEPLAAKASQAGVVFDTLQNALRAHEEIVREHLLAQPSRLGSEKFSALHEAFLEDGAFIHVPKGVEVELALGIFHYAAGDSIAHFPHTLVVADERSKVTVADFFRSAPEGPGGSAPRQLICGGNDLHLGHGASVTYIAMQDWSRNALSIQLNATVVRRDARVLSVNLHSGGRQARHESFSRLQAPGAHSDKEFDQRTLQVHEAPNTSSNLLYKNALLDEARTIFSGLIVVDPDAQKTDAYQANRNLMLSPDAEAQSLPGLEIQANDVRCTHGATSSRIDAEQEFYLLSRGIRKAQADELLVFGFFEEVLGKIEDPKLHESLTRIIRQKFKEGSR